MEFLCLLLASLLFDVIFCGVCECAGRAILYAVCPERRVAAGDKVGDRAQKGALKQADKNARSVALIGLAFWCVLGVGIYLLCVI